MNQVVSGIQIQLLTYLDEMAEQKNFESAGVLYFNLLDTIVKADKNLSDEEIKKQLNISRASLYRAIDELYDSKKIEKDGNIIRLL